MPIEIILGGIVKEKLPATVRTLRQERDCVRICAIRIQCNDQERPGYSSTCLKSYMVPAMRFAVGRPRVSFQTSFASTTGTPGPAPASSDPPTSSVARPFKFILASSKRIASWFGVTCQDCPTDTIWGCYVTKSCWKVVIVALGVVFLFIALLMSLFFLGQIDDLLKYQRQLAEWEKSYPTLAKLMISPLKHVHKAVSKTYNNTMKSLTKKFGSKAWFKFIVLWPCACLKGTWTVLQKILQPTCLFCCTATSKIKKCKMNTGLPDFILKKTGVRADPVGDAKRKKRLEKKAKEDAKQAKIDAREAKKQAKIDAREAKKNAREDAKQAKIDAKKEKLETKKEARQEAFESKKEAKQEALEAKKEAKEAAQEARKAAEEKAAKKLKGPAPPSPPLSPPPPPPSPAPPMAMVPPGMPSAMPIIPPAMPLAPPAVLMVPLAMPMAPPAVPVAPPALPNQQPMYGDSAQQYAAGAYGDPAQQFAAGAYGDPAQQFAAGAYGDPAQQSAADPYGALAQQYAADPYGAPAQQYAADPHGQYGAPAGQAQGQGYGAYDNPMYTAEQYEMYGNDPMYAQQGGFGQAQQEGGYGQAQEQGGYGQAQQQGGFGQAQYGAAARATVAGYGYDPYAANAQQYYSGGYYSQ